MARSQVWTVLTCLKDPGIVGFKKGDTVSPENRSAFNPRPADDSQLLGMGYVKAIASLLQGAVQQVEIGPYAAGGRIAWRLSGRELELSWRYDKDSSGDPLVVGGFAHSDGKPTYQVAVIGLVWRLAQLAAGSGSADALAEELCQRWWDLVRAMDEFAPRTSPTPWDVGDIQRAFINSEGVRACVERVCDSLEWSLRLCETTGAVRGGPRPVEIETGCAWVGSFTVDERITADMLLALQGEPEPQPQPVPAAEAEADLTAAIPDDGSGIFGPYIERIMRAMQRPGSLGMLVGPTATGKTTQAIEAAHRLDCGVELVQLDPGKDAQELVGGFTPHQSHNNNNTAAARSVERWLEVWQVQYNDNGSGMLSTLRTASDTLLTALRGIARVLYLIYLLLKAKLLEQPNDWAPVDGPLTRWARRAIAGEQVVLILDELARGHPSVIALVMGVLNRHNRETIERQGLTIPQGCEALSTFHILDCWHTRERLVIPADRIRIIATSNLGDKYLGMDLNDPAFRRRWDAWLHLGAYDSDVQTDILKSRMADGSDALIRAMLEVQGAVAALQRDTEKLVATLDLATLIAWGVETQARVADGTPPNTAFQQTARDIWIDRVCPLAGADLDSDVRSDLVRFTLTLAPNRL